jgi:polyisoprenoid-binding protein YceI
VSGALEIRGRKAPVAFDLTVRDGLACGDVELTPSRWGIEPFTALLGAMAVQDRVVVRLAIPVEEAPAP